MREFERASQGRTGARFYKVVREQNDILRSIVEHPGAVTYAPGKWVSSSAGPLFVFSSLREARAYARMYGASVWRCHVQGVRPARGIALADPRRLRAIPAAELANAWHIAPSSPGSLLSRLTVCPPDGSCLADAVKLAWRLKR